MAKGRTSDAFRIVLFASLTHFMVHLYVNSFSGLLKAFQTEWHGDYAATGSLGVPLFFLFGVMAIPGGWLSDRFGSKRLLLVCLFGAALASLAASATHGIMGLSPMVMLAALLGLLGLFAGIYHPAGLSFISRGVRRRGRAMGIHGIMGSLGLAAAPFLAAWLASTFGWRTTFLVLSLPAILIGTALLLCPFEPQAGTGRDARTFALKDLLPPAQGGFVLHPVVVLYAIAALNGLAYRGILVYLPSFFRDKLGDASFLSLGGMVLAGMISTVVLLMGTVGQGAGGFLADRGLPERTYCLTYLFTAPFLWLMAQSTGALLIVSGLVFALIYFSLQPQKNALLAGYAGRTSQGLAFGFIFFLEFGFGSFGAAIAGLAADRWGVACIFQLAAAMMLAMAGLAALLIPRHSPHSP